MRLLCALSIFCAFVVISSAIKATEENVDPVEAESKEHSSKKYSQEFQKPHHHGHKHKKHVPLEETPKAEAVKPKDSPVEVPEQEVKLQSDVETSKKAIDEQKQKQQTEDLHLQDLAYEESLKKTKKNKRGHHGAHQAEVLERKKSKKDDKLFTEAGKTPTDKVIEDSFEPLKETRPPGERKKGKGKKSKGKKASDKSKDKSKKPKEGKKKKDKKNKNKDRKY